MFLKVKEEHNVNLSSNQNITDMLMYVEIKSNEDLKIYADMFREFTSNRGI